MEPTNKESGGIYRVYVKRILDLVTASLAFLILSPLIAVFAVLVMIKLGSPVIFRQARAGRRHEYRRPQAAFHLLPSALFGCLQKAP